MVNKNELKILRELEEEGWKVLNRGAPDFLCLKINNDKIKRVKFVEVKAGSDELTYEQSIYKKVLEKLGGKYEVRYVNAHVNPTHATPIQTIRR